MTFGFSRDDASSFLNDYYQKGILKFDPFKTIDKEGVGRLIEVSITLAKRANPIPSNLVSVVNTVVMKKA